MITIVFSISRLNLADFSRLKPLRLVRGAPAPLPYCIVQRLPSWWPPSFSWISSRFCHLCATTWPDCWMMWPSSSTRPCLRTTRQSFDAFGWTVRFLWLFVWHCSRILASSFRWLIGQRGRWLTISSGLRGDPGLDWSLICSLDWNHCFRDDFWCSLCLVCSFPWSSGADGHRLRGHTVWRLRSLFPNTFAPICAIVIVIIVSDDSVGISCFQKPLYFGPLVQFWKLFGHASVMEKWHSFFELRKLGP